MLSWAMIFLLAGIIMALVGFTSMLGASVIVAKILAILFFILFFTLMLLGRKPKM